MKDEKYAIPRVLLIKTKWKRAENKNTRCYHNPGSLMKIAESENAGHS